MSSIETKWLEDLICLRQMGSFSQAASARHVTQPAFSRRIQALESWAGVKLVDRSRLPPQLTSQGKALCLEGHKILEALQFARASVTNMRSSESGVVEVAAVQTLATNFFPNWWSKTRRRCGNGVTAIRPRVHELDLAEAVQRLHSGECGILAAYKHPVLQGHLPKYDVHEFCIGKETIAPFVRPDEQGRPLFRMVPGTRVPLLGYTPSSCFASMVGSLLELADPAICFDVVYEARTSESLKAMALQGDGVAFLPVSTVTKELRSRRLTRAAPSADLELAVQVCLYRKKWPGPRATAVHLEALWACIDAKGAAHPE